MPFPPPLSRDLALFLDFDGTLVEIADEPQNVRVKPDLVTVLSRRSIDLQQALAVISGRPLREIDGFLAPLKLSGAGLHGLESRFGMDAAIESQDIGPEINILRERLAASEFRQRGISVEDKGVALAVHFRAVPEEGPFVRKFLESAIADLSGLHLLDGKMVVEAKPDISDKGKAVQTFMRLGIFNGRVPVFIGDDKTDEDGMRAAADLGGYGIKVGAGDSAAQWRLPNVDAVLAWLAA